MWTCPHCKMKTWLRTHPRALQAEVLKKALSPAVSSARAGLPGRQIAPAFGAPEELWQQNQEKILA